MLLRAEGIDPRGVAIVLHTPGAEAALNRLVPMALVQSPKLFETYQRTHPMPAERTLRRRPFVASFLGRAEAEMIFVGLYRITAQETWNEEDFAADPGFRAYSALFTDKTFEGWLRRKRLTERTVFSLEAVPAMEEYRGRLVIIRPSGRSYVRLAESLDPEVTALYPEQRYVPPPPDWRDFVLSTTELRCLPVDWAARLREWRGVYLILDERDGARYVGSAYGQQNLLGRWQAHVRRDQGVTVELLRRDTISFRFSILERLNPDCSAREAVAAETRWKMRLGTIKWGLNVA